MSHQTFQAGSSSDSFWVGLLFLVGGLVGFFWGMRTYLRRRLILQTPTSKIKSAALGTVELCGKVWEGSALVSPICQLPCAWYRYRVEEEHTNSKGRKSWSTILTGTSDEAFYMLDETGAMLIDPVGAEIDVPSDYTQIFGGWSASSLPSSMAAFLESQGTLSHGLFGTSRRLRFTEYRMEPNDPCFVLGTLVERTDLKERSLIAYENLMVCADERICLISDTSEKGQLDRLFWRAFGGLIIGAVVAVAGFMILLTRFRML